MNATKRKIRLRPEDSFCSIYFAKLAGDVDGDPRADTELPMEEQGLWERFKYKFEPRADTIILAFSTVLAAVLSAILTVHLTNKSPRQNSVAPQNTVSTNNGASPQPLQIPTNLPSRTP